jgi:hypothetical protein
MVMLISRQPGDAWRSAAPGLVLWVPKTYATRRYS